MNSKKKNTTIKISFKLAKNKRKNHISKQKHPFTFTFISSDGHRYEVHCFCYCSVKTGTIFERTTSGTTGRMIIATRTFTSSATATRTFIDSTTAQSKFIISRNKILNRDPPGVDPRGIDHRPCETPNQHIHNSHQTKLQKEKNKCKNPVK